MTLQEEVTELEKVVARLCRIITKHVPACNDEISELAMGHMRFIANGLKGRSREKLIHGINCEVAQHKGSIDLTHDEGDNSPFHVGRTMYCGRCHKRLSN